MTACNKCGAPMVPDHTALVPALGCLACGRLIPITDAPRVRVKSQADVRRQVNRALRAQRRMRMGGAT